ncbi:hypothetical protein [Legionella sp. 227]
MKSKENYWERLFKVMSAVGKCKKISAENKLFLRSPSNYRNAH